MVNAEGDFGVRSSWDLPKEYVFEAINKISYAKHFDSRKDLCKI